MAGSTTLPDSVAGPVAAEVVRVVDGDTVAVRARVWVGLTADSLVRLDGVDTPELRGKCDQERALAEQARDFLTALIGDGQVLLHGVASGKFAGRVVARMETANGDAGTALMAAGLARAYDGGARGGWCDSLVSAAP
ncbi:MAG: thermonuclease family protein [Alphaproteobacteria bacterium]